MNSIRIKIVLILLAATTGCLSASGQVMVSPAFSKKIEQPKGPAFFEISASPAPDPLLQHRLWPAIEHRRDSNPSPIVSRAVILALKQPLTTKQQFSDRYSQWVESPINELPLEELHEFLESYREPLRELKHAENLMQLEYNIGLDQLSGVEMLQTLLPELQEMRNLGRILDLRIRLAIAEKRWNDMIEDCRIGLRLAEISAHSTDFLISRLIGFATSSIIMDSIEVAISQPDCPNLYWALATLPAERLFETRESIEFESVIMSRLFEGIDSMPNKPIGEASSQEKLISLVHNARVMLNNGNPPFPDDSSTRVLTAGYVAMLADPSREILENTEVWKGRTQELSHSEIVLRAAYLRFTRLRDRWLAWSMLPPEQWVNFEAERDVALGLQSPQADILMSLVKSLTPGVTAARRAGRRSLQQRNWLCTMEAIRMHASQHGRLPESIEQLRPVPAFYDSLGNKPFGYQRSTSNAASLTRSSRYADDPGTSVQIVLRKPNE